MPNLINQMRNGQQAPQLNNLSQVKNLMNTMQMSVNPQQYLANMINQNPALVSLIRSGGNLQTIAQQMARERGIDLNKLIAILQGE